MKTIENYLVQKGFEEGSTKFMIPSHAGSHMTIEMLIRDYSSKTLEMFLQQRSDSNKYLSASQQEDLENEFLEFVKNVL